MMYNSACTSLANKVNVSLFSVKIIIVNTEFASRSSQVRLAVLIKIVKYIMVFNTNWNDYV